MIIVSFDQDSIINRSLGLKCKKGIVAITIRWISILSHLTIREEKILHHCKDECSISGGIVDTIGIESLMVIEATKGLKVKKSYYNLNPLEYIRTFVFNIIPIYRKVCNVIVESTGRGKVFIIYEKGITLMLLPDKRIELQNINMRGGFIWSESEEEIAGISKEDSFKCTVSNDSLKCTINKDQYHPLWTKNINSISYILKSPGSHMMIALPVNTLRLADVYSYPTISNGFLYSHRIKESMSEEQLDPIDNIELLRKAMKSGWFRRYDKTLYNRYNKDIASIRFFEDSGSQFLDIGGIVEKRIFNYPEYTLVKAYDIDLRIPLDEGESDHITITTGVSQSEIFNIVIVNRYTSSVKVGYYDLEGQGELRIYSYQFKRYRSLIPYISDNVMIASFIPGNDGVALYVLMESEEIEGPNGPEGPNGLEGPERSNSVESSSSFDRSDWEDWEYVWEDDIIQQEMITIPVIHMDKNYSVTEIREGYMIEIIVPSEHEVMSIESLDSYDGIIRFSFSSPSGLVLCEVKESGTEQSLVGNTYSNGIRINGINVLQTYDNSVTIDGRSYRYSGRGMIGSLFTHQSLNTVTMYCRNNDTSVTVSTLDLNVPSQF